MDEAYGEITETQDFMNVESFSQLPFISRPPSKNKNPNKPIRLFGKDFTGGDYSGNQEDYSDSSETKTKQDEEDDKTGETNGKDYSNNNNNNNNRRFECHYCFRNFPTSQALGGHQNAHKRERQLAKRGSSSYFHHPDANLYGYRHYPSWSSNPLPATARFYRGGHASSYHQARPINGLWRVPPSSSVQGVYNSNAAFTSHHDSFLASSQPQPPSSHVVDSAIQNRMLSSSSYRYGLSPNVQGHLSLDLHL